MEESQVALEVKNRVIQLGRLHGASHDSLMALALALGLAAFESDTNASLVRNITANIASRKYPAGDIEEMLDAHFIP